MLIDCDTCAARDVHCGDCVVMVLLGRRHDPIGPATPEPAGMSRRDRTARDGITPGQPAFEHPLEHTTIELDSAEESALGAFVSGGLLPPLRLVPTYRSPQPPGTGPADETAAGQVASA